MIDKALLQECYDQLRIMFNPDVPLMQKLTARLAQGEPEAIMWLKVDEDGDVAGFHWAFPLPQGEYSVYPVPYPPQREWQGLTDDEVNDAARYCVRSGQSVNSAIRAIEAKLKEKNNG